MSLALLHSPVASVLQAIPARTAGAPAKLTTHEISLAELNARLLRHLVVEAQYRGETSIADELDRVAIPVQGLAGNSKEFSFMAFSLPRMTAAELRSTPLGQERSVVFDFEQGSVKIDLDDFGRINWMRFLDLEDEFSKLTSILAERRLSGNSKPLWSY